MIDRARHTIEYADDRQADIPLRTRNAGLADLVDILKQQQARKVDVVAPASAIRSEHGEWVVEGADAEITLDGVTPTDGRFRPTAVADGHLAERLGIPVQYLRRLRDERPDLYDANVNGWLHGGPINLDGDGEQRYDSPDPRSFLVRTFRGDDGGTGVARAMLSDRYRIVDHLDVLTAALDGVRSAGVAVDITAADLTDRRMYVKINAPEIRELAPDLLDGYRSPFTGNVGAENPAVFAGLVIGNSETGGGALTLTPRIVFEVCDNGMTITKDALRNVHIGGKMDEGVIRWSDEAQEKNLDLIRLKTRDAVSTFLDLDYMRTVLDRIRQDAGTPIEKPQETVQHVASTLKLAAASDDILAHFIAGGDLTAGGVMNAITSYAQTVDDGDTAADIEAAALDALSLAAA